MKQVKCRTATPYPFNTNMRSIQIRNNILSTLKQIKNKLNKTRKIKNKLNRKIKNKKKVTYNSRVNKVYNNDLY